MCSSPVYRHMVGFLYITLYPMALLDLIDYRALKNFLVSSMRTILSTMYKWGWFSLLVFFFFNYYIERDRDIEGAKVRVGSCQQKEVRRQPEGVISLLPPCESRSQTQVSRLGSTCFTCSTFSPPTLVFGLLSSLLVTAQAVTSHCVERESMDPFVLEVKHLVF